MQIKRKGFLFRTAYGFMDEDKRPVGYINGCSLLWRFILLVLPGILMNIAVIFLGFIVLGGIINIGRFVWGMLTGKRLIHVDNLFKDEPDSDFVWSWLKPLGSKVSASEYRLEEITNWPKAFGVRLLPGVMILTVVGVGIEIWAMWTAGARWATQGVRVFVDIPTSLVTLQIGVLIVGLIIIPFAWSLNSEPAKLLRARVRSFKDRTCPTVEVVE